MRGRITNLNTIKYQEYLNDIRDAKKFQWVSAYYILFFQAGLLFIIEYIDRFIKTPMWNISIMYLVIVISVAVAIFGVMLQFELRNNILSYRKQKEKILRKRSRDNTKICGGIYLVIFNGIIISTSFFITIIYLFKIFNKI